MKLFFALTLSLISLRTVRAFVTHDRQSRCARSTSNVLESNDDGLKRPLQTNALRDAFTKAMGMAFDHKRQRWVRGKVPSGAEVVSFGGRRLDVVGAGGDDLGEPRPAVVAAAAHLQEVLRAARADAGALEPTVVQRVAAQHAGVYLWAFGQAVAMTLSAHVMVS
jgi:hypothetical protein